MSRASQPSTDGRGEKAQDRRCVAQRTFYGEWEIPVPNALPNQPTAEKFQQTHEPDPFINVSFEPRHHYPPIAPAGKLALQSSKSSLRTASSTLDRLSDDASTSPSFQPSSNTDSNAGVKQRQVRTCSLCNEPGHNMFTCPKRPCTRCQQMGHVKTYCDVAKEAANQVSKARVQRNKAITTTKNAGKFGVSRNNDIQDGSVSGHEGEEGKISASSWRGIMPERKSERMGERETRRVRIDDLLNPK